MIRRLAAATLDLLPDWVERPVGTRPQVRVVHLGAGAFHRAHQAVAFDELGWGVTAASLLSTAARDALAPQDGLYSLVVHDSSDERVRIVAAIRDVIVAPEAPAALLEALAASTTDIVTVTVTEKGYRPGEPMPELVARALALRRLRGLAPFTAISCDNLADNGTALRSAVLGAAGDPALRDWIEAEGAFPQTMVDRIVPATREQDIEALAERIGLVDRAMVKTEPFSQWVIEDRFAGPRPDFQAAGVQVVADVAPYEQAKLRLLNGAHSAIAYLGGLAGIDTVDAFVADPARRGFVEALWDESQATLAPPPGLDLAAYRRDLLARFANHALGHRTAQIAIDGSQKLPQRLLAPIAVRRDRGAPIDALALAVAAWIRWQGGRTDAGQSFEVDDPLAAETRRLLAGTAAPADQVRAMMTLETVFPRRLAEDFRFADALTAALTALAEYGAVGALARFGTQSAGRR